MSLEDLSEEALFTIFLFLVILVMLACVFYPPA